MFSDKFRQYSSRAYAERREYIAKNTADIIAAQKEDMRTALEYLYGTLPRGDIRFTPFEWLEEACAAALATRAANQYGADIPEDIFAQYVLCPRVNNERAQRHRRFFAEKLKARVQGKSIADVALSVVLCAAVLVLYILFYHRLFAITFDESFSRATGVKVGAYHSLLALLTALTVVLGMRMMGAMLISSLIIFPALSAMRIFKSFRAVVVCAGALSVVCFCTGLIASYLLSTPVGASVVLCNLLVFLLCCLAGRR